MRHWLEGFHHAVVCDREPLSYDHALEHAVAEGHRPTEPGRPWEVVATKTAHGDWLALLNDERRELGPWMTMRTNNHGFWAEGTRVTLTSIEISLMPE